MMQSSSTKTNYKNEKERNFSLDIEEKVTKFSHRAIENLYDSFQLKTCESNTGAMQGPAPNARL